MPRMASTTPWVILAPTLAFVPYRELHLSLLSRSIIPRSPPPRPSFRQG
jgi:hypothetical protein